MQTKYMAMPDMCFKYVYFKPNTIIQIAFNNIRTCNIELLLSNGNNINCSIIIL